MIDRDLPSHPRRLQRAEGHPEGGLDLWADDNGGLRRQREYKWAYHDGRQDGSPRVQVIQNAELLSGGKIDADFFECLADRGCPKIGIGWFATPAGKCDLARPRVPDAHGAVNEQCLESGVAVVQNHGDGRGDHSSFKRNFDGSIVPQPEACGFQRGDHPNSQLLTPSS